MPAAAGRSMPAHSGCAAGKTPVECNGLAYTGAPRASASWATAPTAPDALTSSPTTMASFPTAGSVSRTASSSRLAATDRRSIREATGTGASPSSSRVDIRMLTNTGPGGGAVASWKARRRIVPSSSRLRTSCAHFDTGAASPTRSPARSGSATRWRSSCCPAVTTSGVRLAWALVRFPMALPRPAEVWRLRNAGRPVAWA